MPIHVKSNKDGVPVPTYHIPVPLDPDPTFDAILRAGRSRTQVERERLVALQKEASKSRDFELARHYSDLAKDCIKQYRSFCLFLGWYGLNPLPGDCPPIPPGDWSVELHPELDHVLRVLYLS